MKKARPLSIIIITVLTIYFIVISGCGKEYSCEGCATIPPQDTTIVSDPPAEDTSIAEYTGEIDSTLHFPFCATCNDSLASVLNKIKFRNYQSLLCFNIFYTTLDSGYIVTIRGFQDCVKDTQFLVTGKFPKQTFEANRTNIPASYSNCLLYAPNNVVLAVAGGTNGTPLTMRMVLDTFDHLTGIASFRFFGYAYTNKGGSSYVTGDGTYISDGTIKVKIQ